MIWDIIIIGAGIVGCAAARELSRYDASILVLEAGGDVAEGATKANSGIIHAGFDAHPGTLKAHYNVIVANLYEKYCEELGVSYSRCGALVIALGESQKQKIQELYQRGIENGVQDLRIIDRDAVLRMEPDMNPDVVCALYAPTSAIVSPYEVAFAAADDAAVNGVSFAFEEQVLKVSRPDEGGLFLIETEKNSFSCRSVINCAGTGSAEKRRANAAGVYACPQPDRIEGKRILLVDDIVTTGATLCECAKMLHTAGAAEICGVAVASRN